MAPTPDQVSPFGPGNLTFTLARLGLKRPVGQRGQLCPKLLPALFLSRVVKRRQFVFSIAGWRGATIPSSLNREQR